MHFYNKLFINLIFNILLYFYLLFVDKYWIYIGLIYFKLLVIHNFVSNFVQNFSRKMFDYFYKHYTF